MPVDHLRLSSEVDRALKDGTPVVALESTIIAHGLPRPLNLEVARKTEQEVRKAGAVPATVAVLSGRIGVGLSDAELDQVAGFENKFSRADLAPAAGLGLSGATTIAATMVAAKTAGIKVFATGGIGGVHHGASDSFDVSADLEELGHTQVAVVCSGIKSVLDVPASVEYLETKGVPLVGYGTAELPAFHSRNSGVPVPHRVDSPRDAAAVIAAHWRLEGAGGIVVANPVPEGAGVSASDLADWRQQALSDAKAKGITGKEVTPFLLSRISELSGGATVEANVALILGNAALAAKIAGELLDI